LTPKQTDRALGAIYAGPPSDFVQGRDALAKKLRSDGAGDEADRVGSLRKPSKAAAVLNALSREQPKPVKRYLGLAEKLRKATSGKVDVKRMRELAREEGELLEELVADAGKLGDRASASTLDRVRETLQAAQVDAELRDRVVAGRVEREARAASVGLDNLAAPPVATRPRSKTKSDKGADDAKRKRLEDAKADLKDAKTAAREAARDVARAETALGKAKRARDAADDRVERAKSKLETTR